MDKIELLIKIVSVKMDIMKIIILVSVKYYFVFLI